MTVNAEPAADNAESAGAGKTAPAAPEESPEAMRPARRRFWIAAAAVLAADLASKPLVFGWLGASSGSLPGGPHGESVWVLPGLFRLSAHVNEGAAFGVLSGRIAALVAAAAILVPMLTAMAYGCRRPAAPLWALGLVVGGSLGNLYDRLFLLGVRDFFELTDPRTERALWAIFNVADAAIVVGAAWYVAWSLFVENRGRPAAAGQGGPDGG